MNKKPSNNADSDVQKSQPNTYYDLLQNKRKKPSVNDEQLQIDIFQEHDEDMKMYEATEQKLEIPKNIYSREEAFAKTVEYFNGDELAANVWINKYALKDSDNNLYELTPDDMHRRIAKEIARIERRYENPLTEDEIFDLLKEFKYIVPQGSPMAGIGNNFQIGSLSNCFVIGNGDNADSYGGIMKIDEEQVQLMKRRGGVGHDLSDIRPKGSHVKNSALTSTGIIPFMERFSNSTREVAQDGRRGALMLSISIKHPDAEDFIDAKMTQGKVTGANISVRINDEFMKAAINNTPYTQQYPINSNKPSFKKDIEAKKLWDKIIHNAWQSAEPGILFWDTIERESIPDCYAHKGFKTTSTNPCGEIPLCPYDSCRLLAINLYSYVENPFTEDAYFNEELFTKHVRYAQKIMDDIIDLELEKIETILKKIESDPENEEIKRREIKLWHNIKQKCLEGRRTGIGITAEGDMLAALGLKYGSEKATYFSVAVHKTLAIEAYRSSVTLAKERKPFKVYDASLEKNNPFILRLKESDPELYSEMLKYGRRNIALLTIAPTGSVSLMTQTTSGFEPAFQIFYKRRRKVNPGDKDVKISFKDGVGDSWEEFAVFHHKFIEWLKANNYNPEEVKTLPEKELNDIIIKSPYGGATANDVDWVSKVKMQGQVQKWIDHSISVTVNVPNDVPESLIADIYKTAWESGCKGVTVYRDGSRDGVLINNNKENRKCDFKENSAPPRPKELQAEIVRFNNNKEKWVAVVGLLDDRPYEIFTGKATELSIPESLVMATVTKNRDKNGKSRYDIKFIDHDGFEGSLQGLNRTFSEDYWNYAKLISGVLRHGMPLSSVVNMVANLKLNDETMNTWKNGVERALKKFIPDGTKAVKKVCEKCEQNSLVYQEGCLICMDCGYYKCGE